MSRKLISLFLVSTLFVTSLVFAQSQDQDIQQVLKKIAENLRNLALAAALIGIVFGGFYFITAGGDEKRLATGRAIILWSLVGATIILIAGALANIVKEATQGTQ